MCLSSCEDLSKPLVTIQSLESPFQSSGSLLEFQSSHKFKSESYSTLIKNFYLLYYAKHKEPFLGTLKTSQEATKFSTTSKNDPKLHPRGTLDIFKEPGLSFHSHEDLWEKIEPQFITKRGIPKISQ